MKRSQSDREIREDVTPGASAGAGIESESEDDCTSSSDHEAGSGDSDMEVSDSGTANKKTSKSKLISENRGKLYNPKKHKGAYRYKTKFDDKWLKNILVLKVFITSKCNANLSSFSLGTT